MIVVRFPIKKSLGLVSLSTVCRKCIENANSTHISPTAQWFQKLPILAFKQ